MRDDKNPVARSNVCPEQHKPAEPSFHAFCFTRAVPGASGSFVIAGSGEAEEGHASYRERTVRFGDTSPDGLREKGVYVLNRMEQRMAAVGVPRGLKRRRCRFIPSMTCIPSSATRSCGEARREHGLTWHFARPPVVGLDYEMDCRGVPVEHRISPP